MTKHIADQPRERAEGTRVREYTRIEREQGAGGPHATTQGLQRRRAGSISGSRRTEEFLRRDRKRRA